MAFSIILIPNDAVLRHRGGHRHSDAVQAWCSDGHLPVGPHPADFRAGAFRADGYPGAGSPADGYRAGEFQVVVFQVVVFQAALFPVDAGQVAACRAVGYPEAEIRAAGCREGDPNRAADCWVASTLAADAADDRADDNMGAASNHIPKGVWTGPGQHRRRSTLLRNIALTGR